MGDRATSVGQRPSYFFVAVSTKENLDLCREYGLAGFPGSYNGAWAFVDIEVGDFVSFVYGAKAHDLFRVTDKRAISNADEAPPWPTLEFDDGGSYNFPFRLDLEPERTFVESVVRTEFEYIAENLLLRGGYRRSHFQADQTTLQQVSQMGDSATRAPKQIDWDVAEVKPRWVRRRGPFDPPAENQFREKILQVLIRHQLQRQAGLDDFIQLTGFNSLLDREIEILGERALPEGHLDLLVKDARPVGKSLQLPIEVKLNRASPEDVEQLRAYVEQLHPECPGGVLIAERISGTVEGTDDIAFLEASISEVDMDEPQTLERMDESLELEAVER